MLFSIPGSQDAVNRTSAPGGKGKQFFRRSNLAGNVDETSRSPQDHKTTNGTQKHVLLDTVIGMPLCPSFFPPFLFLCAMASRHEQTLFSVFRREVLSPIAPPPAAAPAPAPAPSNAGDDDAAVPAPGRCPSPSTGNPPPLIPGTGAEDDDPLRVGRPRCVYVCCHPFFGGSV